MFIFYTKYNMTLTTVIVELTYTGSTMTKATKSTYMTGSVLRAALLQDPCKNQ